MNEDACDNRAIRLSLGTVRELAESVLALAVRNPHDALADIFRDGLRAQIAELGVSNEQVESLMTEIESHARTQYDSWLRGEL